LLAPTASPVGRLRLGPATVRLDNTPFYHAPPPAAARRQITRLLRWIRRSRSGVDAVPLAAEAWARFTEAHPFSDGNGRVARALATWILTAAGYRSSETRDLRDYVYQHGVEYYHRLACWKTERFLWYQFCADAVLELFAAPGSPA
jgi:Fic family protein